LRLPDPHRSAPARACLSGGGSFAAAVSRTRCSGPAFVSPGSAAWPGGLGSSLLPSGGAPGVAPFAGLLPIGGWTRGLNPAAKWMRAFDRSYPVRHARCAFRQPSSACFSEHLCSSGPTCLLIDRARAPIFFVGVTAPPVGGTTDLKGGRSGRQRFDPASGLRSRGRSVSPVSMRSDIDGRRRPFLPWALPLSGFSATRCTWSRAGSSPLPRHQPPAIGSPDRAIRSWALRRSFPVERSARRAAAGMILFLPGLLIPGRNRLPFSVLRG